MSQAGIVDIEGAHPQIPTLFVCNVGSAIPIANVLEVLGTTVAAHSIPLETIGSGNIVTIEAQYASASASSVANNAGFSSFNSTQFNVDANGFVSINGGVIGETITGNTGGALSPTAGNWNIVGSGSLTTSGSGSTLTVQLTGITNHAVQVGGSGTTLTQVGPSATTGSVLTSNGAAADPSFQTIASLGAILTITGNDSVAEVPNASGNFNIVGTGSITTVGSLNTETVQLTGLTNHNVLVGAGTATITKVSPSSTSGVPLISQGASADPAFGTAVVAGGGTGAVTFTAHGVLLGQGTSPVTATSVGATGTVLAGNTGADPTFQTVASLGAILTITGNSGGAEVPTAGGNFNVLGTGSITVAGSANTETVQLTGLTNHNVLVGAGTATITNVSPSATSGVPLISQGSTSDPAFGTAVVAGGGTGSTSFNTTGVVISGSTSTTALTSITLTDGQLAIGSSAGNPAAATITAGTGITVTNGHNSITIAATGSGFPYTDEATSFNAASNNGYFITGTATATLPASPSQGDTIVFIVDTTNVLTITANTGQVIRIGNQVSASAGTAASNARGDSVALVYRSGDTAWISRGAPQGTWTIT